ncbi:MAG: DUF4352 domain-containing protein [Actinomycetia bacterium]|nr:DUF4352 domain-containing protein [Actinomycetes bacterium]
MTNVQPPIPPGGGQQPVQAQVAPPQPAPQKPRRAGGKGKWILLALGIIVIIVVIAAIAGGGGEKKEATKTEKPAETTEEATEKTETAVTVGQPVTCGDLSITVHSFHASPGEEMFTPKAGNQYIVVDLEINNDSKETKAVSTMMQMSIKTPEGYGYDQAMYFPEPKYPDGDILAGQKARGQVAFEVPANIGAMSFVFSPMFGDPVDIKLQ